MTGTEPSSTPAHRFGAEALRKVSAWPETVGTMDTVIDWVFGNDPEMVDGKIQADPDNDVVYCAVGERPTSS